MEEEIAAARAYLANIFDEAGELDELLCRLANNLQSAALNFSLWGAGQDFSHLQAAAHKLKSETAFCQLKSLTALLEEIEAQAKAQDNEAIPKAVARFATLAEQYAEKL